MSRISRRSLLRALAVATASVAATGLGLLRPRAVRAAEWPKDAFSAKTPQQALLHLYGSQTPTPSAHVMLRAPFVASDAMRVPITVTTQLRDVESITVLVDRNPQPLVAHVTTRHALGYFSTQIKMAETSAVRCIVKAGGKLYSTQQTIKVPVSTAG